MASRRAIRVAWGGTLLAGVVLALTLAANASAYLYWGDENGSIGRATLDGARMQKIFIDVRPDQPCGIEVTSTHVYWANLSGGTIGRATLDGKHVKPDFITGAGESCGIAADRRFLYWANQEGPGIGRARLDGSHVNANWIPSLTDPNGVAVTRSHIYWGDQVTGDIGRATLARTLVRPDFITGGSSVQGDPYIVGSRIWWTDFGLQTIARASLDGSHVRQTLIPVRTGACGLVLHGGRVFFADYRNGGIGRVDADGAHLQPHFINLGLHEPCGMGVDSLP